VSKTITVKSYSNVVVGSTTDTTTITYDDGHGTFFNGTGTKTFTAGSNKGTVVTNTYTGSNIRLTPLTLAMMAGKTIKVAAPNCTNGVSTFTVDATGTISTNSDSSLEVATLATSSIAGLLTRTSPTSASAHNDGSVLYVGLDGPSIAAGSAFVFVTENCGYVNANCNYPAWGRLQIISVN